MRDDIQADYDRAQRTVDEMTPAPPWPLRLCVGLIIGLAAFLWISGGLLAWLLGVVSR